MNDKNSRLVYSTETGSIKENVVEPVNHGDGTVLIRRETKGRKGKGVTILNGLGLKESELKPLAKKLKQKCSTGGTVKDGSIEVQGDHRAFIKNELEILGYTVKVSGG